MTKLTKNSDTIDLGPVRERTKGLKKLLENAGMKVIWPKIYPVGSIYPNLCLLAMGETLERVAALRLGDDLLLSMGEDYGASYVQVVIPV